MHIFPPNTIIVLLCHGSKDPRWAEPMRHLASMLQSLMLLGNRNGSIDVQAPQNLQMQRTDVQIQCAFLEHTPPDLMELANLWSPRETYNVHILPMFLGMGKHVREDLPVLCQELQAHRPLWQVHLEPSLGEQNDILQGLAKLIHSSLSKQFGDESMASVALTEQAMA